MALRRLRRLLAALLSLCALAAQAQYPLRPIRLLVPNPPGGATDTVARLVEPQTAERIRHVGGLEPYISTPEEFAAPLRAEYAKYGEVARAVGAKTD